MKVIKIGAVWCNGCNTMRPRWKEIESELSWLKTVYLDFDNDQEKVKKYELDQEKLPVAIFLDNDGKEICREYGEVSKEKLIETIMKYRDK